MFDGTKTQSFCKKECYSAYQKGKKIPPNIQNKNGVKPSNQVTTVCAVCKKEFKHWAGRKSKYCSKECWNKRSPKELFDCVFCGKEFWSRKSANKTYCTKKCYSVHLRELKKGSKSPFWKGGKTKLNTLERCRGEYREWRNGVFIRDSYTCQKCGIKSVSGVVVYLHAHHIKHFAQEPTERFKIENGITLCKDCHLLEHHHKF